MARVGTPQLRRVLGAAVMVAAAAHCGRPSAGAPDGVGDARARTAEGASDGVTTAAASSSTATAAEPGQGSAAKARPAAPPVVDTEAYPWHADPSLTVLTATTHLEDRVAPPAGFERVALEPASFGAWLRRLPLAEPDTPVKAYDGRVLLRVGHPNLAAVSTLDIGAADLQQCADAVMRLHAEWSWSRGRRDMSYRAAAGTPLPYARWSRGERVELHGRSLRWVPKGSPGGDHRSFRKYLDAVFSWANTVSLDRQASAVPLGELRPGDFFVLPGGPGHTVLVLDLARAADGRRVVLLGQSYMPAQSFQVLRPAPSRTWFRIDPDAEGVQTPFWPAPFPWSSLRRLD